MPGNKTDGKVEKARTGWVSGAFGWGAPKAKNKTELKAVLGTHDVSTSLPANLSNLPSASAQENLPDPVAAPLSLNQMKIVEADNPAPPEPPKVDAKFKPIDEGLDDSESDYEHELAPLLSLPPFPRSAPYQPNNLSFEGPLPPLAPVSQLMSLPVITPNQGATIHAQVSANIVAIHRAWTEMVAPAVALKVAVDTKVGNAAISERKHTSGQKLEALTELLSATNALIRKNHIALVQYDTPNASGKDICAKVDDELDMMKRNIVMSDTGELRVPLPKDSYSLLTLHINTLADSCFRVMASALSGRGTEMQYTQQQGN